METSFALPVSNMPMDGGGYLLIGQIVSFINGRWYRSIQVQPLTSSSQAYYAIRRVSSRSSAGVNKEMSFRHGRMIMATPGRRCQKQGYCTLTPGPMPL